MITQNMTRREFVYAAAIGAAVYCLYIAIQ